MTNAIVKNLMAYAAEELKKEKLILIEDIIKAKRLAFGFGLKEHASAISDWLGTFNELYDMPIGKLQEYYTGLQKELSAKARILAGIDAE